jgi:hypothetical protein
MHRLANSELRDFPDLYEFYAVESSGAPSGSSARSSSAGWRPASSAGTDALVAARMLSALLVTHGTWYHQKHSFKSIANIPDGVLLAQIRDFFLHAMRPDDGPAPSMSTDE